MPQFKAKVATAEYLVERDLLVFTLIDLESNKEQTYCWSPSDYFAAIGIPVGAKYTPEQLHTHCEQMIGKHINFEIDGEPSIEAEEDPIRAQTIAAECDVLAKEAGDKLDRELQAVSDYLSGKARVDPADESQDH